MLIAATLRRRLRLRRAAINTHRRSLRGHQRLEAWEQAQLDAWEDDGIHPSDFAQEYPYPETTETKES